MYEIGVRYGKKLQPDAIRYLQPAVTAGRILGSFIRRRVGEDGRAADGGIFGRHSSATAWIAYGLPQPSGVRLAAGRNSALYEMDQYHTALHGDDKYRVRVTGRMWESLSVSVANSERVRLTFRRSSMSSNARAARKRVPNRTKAAKAQVLARKPLLEPSDPEVQGVLDGLGRAIDAVSIAESLNNIEYGQIDATSRRERRDVRVYPGSLEIPE